MLRASQIIAPVTHLSCLRLISLLTCSSVANQCFRGDCGVEESSHGQGKRRLASVWPERNISLADLPSREHCRAEGDGGGQKPGQHLSCHGLLRARLGFTARQHADAILGVSGQMHHDTAAAWPRLPAFKFHRSQRP